MKLTSLAASVALAALAAGGLAALSAEPADARPTRTLRTCTADVRIFEDGTWMGARIYAADGHLIAPRWEVTGPERRGLDTSGPTPVWLTAFPSEVDGKICTTTIERN